MDDKKRVLDVKDLYVVLKNDTIVNYGSFEINEGDFILIQGRNGSGKSTFFKIFKYGQADNKEYIALNDKRVARSHYDNCEDNIESEIWYYDDLIVGGKANIIPNSNNEQARSRQAEINRRIVDLQQEENFLFGTTPRQAMRKTCERAIQNDEMGLRSPEKRRAAKKRLDELVDKYYKEYLEPNHISEKKFKYGLFSSLSGGQKKIIHILSNLIKAEVMNCRLAIMDEPLNNLDALNKFKLDTTLNEIRAKTNIAIMMITHCQVFNGINGSMTIKKDDTRTDSNYNYATVTKFNKPLSNPHKDCVEQFRKDDPDELHSLLEQVECLHMCEYKKDGVVKLLELYDDITNDIEDDNYVEDDIKKWCEKLKKLIRELEER